jgi:subtilisin-like proprotein convertase family protein
MRSVLVLSGFCAMTACGFGDNGSSSATVDAPAIPIDAPAPKVFEARPAVAIPDNSASGVIVAFVVTGVDRTTGLQVDVDITHKFGGEISIDLLRGATVIKALKMYSSTDKTANVVASYQITPAELGTPLNDTYSVRIADRVINDTGVANLARLTFRVD